MRHLGLAVLFGLALTACTGDVATTPSTSTEAVVGPNMTVAEWSASPAASRATYFRGVVGAHITDPAQNETQRRFDDDLALDLRDCVDGHIEDATPASDAPVRPFINTCLEASGMPHPG